MLYPACEVYLFAWLPSGGCLPPPGSCYLLISLIYLVKFGPDLIKKVKPEALFCPSPYELVLLEAMEGQEKASKSINVDFLSIEKLKASYFG